MAISRAFRHHVRSRLRNSPRASCCVMVLAPRTTGGFAGVGQRGPAHREKIHSHVTHEPTVLGRHDGRDDRRWDLVQGHPDLDAAVLAERGRDLLPVGVEVRDRRPRARRQREDPPSPGQQHQAHGVMPKNQILAARSIMIVARPIMPVAPVASRSGSRLRRDELPGQDLRRGEPDRDERARPEVRRPRRRERVGIVGDPPEGVPRLRALPLSAAPRRASALRRLDRVRESTHGAAPARTATTSAPTARLRPGDGAAA